MDRDSTRTGTVVFSREGQILRGVALPDRVQSLEDAHENLDAARRLSGGVRMPLLLDIRDTGTLSREARQHYAGDAGANVVTRIAMLTNSSFTRVVAKLFIRLAQTRVPVQLFESEEKALRWLSGGAP